MSLSPDGRPPQIARLLHRLRSVELSLLPHRLLHRLLSGLPLRLRVKSLYRLPSSFLSPWL